MSTSGIRIPTVTRVGDSVGNAQRASVEVEFNVTPWSEYIATVRAAVVDDLDNKATVRKTDDATITITAAVSTGALADWALAYFGPVADVSDTDV